MDIVEGFPLHYSDPICVEFFSLLSFPHTQDKTQALPEAKSLSDGVLGDGRGHPLPLPLSDAVAGIGVEPDDSHGVLLSRRAVARK